MKIGIIGAGHAGLSAAATIVAIKNTHQITIFSDENHIPYFRPRIPGIAFNQVELSTAVMHPQEWYQENNINLRLNESVTQITSDCKVRTQRDLEYSFDKIIISAGASPIIPAFAKDCDTTRVIPLWNIQQAERIRNSLPKIKKIAIIGGGVIGLEAALRAADAGLDVSIIERNNHLMERNLPTQASNLITEILRQKGITIYTGNSVQEISDSSSPVEIITNKHNIKAELVILSIGNTFSTKFAEAANLKTNRAFVVNQHLQTSNKNISAAGDSAELPDTINVCSAIKAAQQGKIAGLNAINNNDNLLEFQPEPISVQLKYKDFQLYAMGALPDEKEFKNLILEKNDKIYRALVKNKDQLAGVQMVGSNKDFIKYQQIIKAGTKEYK